MINPHQQLSDNLFTSDRLKQEPTRDGFGRGLVEAGRNNVRVVALCADLAESTRVEWFREQFPERYIEIGVAEQNLATIASGMANYGKIPFIMSYATFSPGRNNEQIRTTISINNVPVKIIGCHAGVSVGPDGATHQALEDIGLMRMQPNMTVIVPCDSNEAFKATVAIAKTKHPAYLRLGRSKSSVFTTEKTPFEIGKAQILIDYDDPDVVIIGAGQVLYHALCASDALKDTIKVSVVNCATIKPLDEKTIITVAKKAQAVVTVEEHQIAGGVGSAIAELLAQKYPVPMEFVGIEDRFGQSGTPEELYKEYGLDMEGIMKKIKKVYERKNS